MSTRIQSKSQKQDGETDPTPDTGSLTDDTVTSTKSSPVLHCV